MTFSKDLPSNGFDDYTTNCALFLGSNNCDSIPVTAPSPLSHWSVFRISLIWLWTPTSPLYYAKNGTIAVCYIHNILNLYTTQMYNLM